MFWVGIIHVSLGEPLAQAAWLSRPAFPFLWRALRDSHGLLQCFLPHPLLPMWLVVTLETGAGFPSSLLFLFLNTSVCLLQAIFIPPFTLPFIALCWLLYFYFIFQTCLKCILTVASSVTRPLLFVTESFPFGCQSVLQGSTSFLSVIKC